MPHATPPGRPLARSVLPAVLLTVLGGILGAGQARVNGALEVHVGVLATSAVSFAVGLVVLLAVVGASRSRRQAVSRLLRGGGQWWWRLGGLGGACVVAVQALGVPLVGVALVSVCLVAGQTVGALVVDRLGLGPGGTRRLTPARFLGAALTVLAVGLGAAGRWQSARPVVFGLLVGVGVVGAVQVAANGQLREVTGSPTVAALANFLVGFTALALLLLVATAVRGEVGLDWPANPLLYAGGLGGTALIVIAAITVHLLGVLRLTLALVGGQLLGAVVIDLAAPGPGGGLPVATLLGAVVTLVAVAVTGLSGRPRPRARAEPAPVPAPTRRF